MNYLHSILIGIIQGITEFLPISSSAHLIVVSYLLDGKSLSLSLNVALHFGTMLAVLVYFRSDWLEITKSYLRPTSENIFHRRLLIFLVLANIPAVILGLLFKDFIEQKLHHPIMTCIPLAFVGVLLWLVDRKQPSLNSIQDLNIKQAFMIGLAQSCALIPGVSRSGATILMGRYLKMDRVSAARFSFLLGTPVMFGATILESKNIAGHFNDPTLYVGVLFSFLSGILAIKFLLKFLQNCGLGWFAIYRVILAGLIFYFVIA